jgi:hypothetical protein
MTSADVRGQLAKFRPAVGPTISVGAIRLAMAIIMAGLCVAVIGFSLLLALGLFLAAAALAFPKIPSVWALALLLAVVGLGPIGQMPEWRFFVVLAGVHALHQFGMTLAWLPITGRVQLRVVARAVRSYLIIQVPAQLVSYVVLVVLTGAPIVSRLSSPLFGLVAAVALLALAAMILVPVLRRSRED